MPSTFAELKVKIWPDLHGDMQSQAEMPWPSIDSIGGNKNVAAYQLLVG